MSEPASPRPVVHAPSEDAPLHSTPLHSTPPQHRSVPSHSPDRPQLPTTLVTTIAALRHTRSPLAATPPHNGITHPSSALAAYRYTLSTVSLTAVLRRRVTIVIPRLSIHTTATKSRLLRLFPVLPPHRALHPAISTPNDSERI